MWEILKIISKGDYNYALVPNHPNATKNGYVLEHRIVMENKIGRLLTDDEIVHHKDENKKNNNPDNLEIKTNEEHSREHGYERGRLVLLIKCPFCQDMFLVYKNQSHLQKSSKYTTCSRKCMWSMWSLGQQYGFSEEVKNRINESIIKEFKYHGKLCNKKDTSFIMELLKNFDSVPRIG